MGHIIVSSHVHVYFQKTWGQTPNFSDSPPAILQTRGGRRGLSGDSSGWEDSLCNVSCRVLYHKLTLLWQSTVAIKSDPVAPHHQPFLSASGEGKINQVNNNGKSIIDFTNQMSQKGVGGSRFRIFS